MRRRFRTKDEARRAAWDELAARGVARFPLPPHGRIPNFAGAREAAERLLDVEVVARARRLKVNPDSPQRPVRRAALERGCVVVMPTPRLRAGFLELDPARIPRDRLAEAAALSKCERWGRHVPVRELEPVDAVVTGSVAVTLDGRRCGKGEGYSDLELAILRELGHDAPVVVTSVHPLQVVERFPRDAHDVALSAIATPEALHVVDDPPPAPTGIDWDLLDEEDLDAMPVLRELAPG